MAPQPGTQPGINQGSRQIAEALGEARQLQTTGRVPEALDRLEIVFALDPGNAAARQLRDQLLAGRQASKQDLLVQETLRTADAHFTGGRFEEAISAANRVLALQRGNPAALGIVRKAYAQISQRLLGTGVMENIPSVAEVDGQICGTVAIRVTGPDSHPGPWLSGLWVDAPFRGRGVAGELTRAMTAEAWQLGYSELFAATATAHRLFHTSAGKSWGISPTTA